MKTKVQSIVFSTLRDYGCNDIETSDFKQLMHNDDLVPRFTKNLNYLVECCGSYGNACYDIQGVRDSGIDVLLKYEDEESGTHYIGLQIKSYNDIKEKDWLTKLKAQILEAKGSWNLDDFFIVFCTDAKEHQNKLRNASADIIKFAGEEVHIVEPSKALNFFRLNSLEILIQVQNHYRADDPVTERAKNSLEAFNLLESLIVIEAAVNFLIDSSMDMEPETLFEALLPQSIQEKYYNVSNEFFSLEVDEQEKYDVNDEKHEGDNWMRLADSGFFELSVYDNTKFLPDGSWALSALILDTKARQGFDVDTLKEYLMYLLLDEKLEIAEKFLTRKSNGRKKTRR